MPGVSPGKPEVLDTPAVGVRRLRTAAGSGARDLGEAVTGYVYFRSGWFSRQGLVADRCSVIGAAGESMEPTLPGGCVVLVDHKRKQLQPGRIFVIRTEDGVVIKREKKTRRETGC